jgi:hypothetical protein
MYLSLSLRAGDCVASARRGLPLGRKLFLLLLRGESSDGAVAVEAKAVPVVMVIAEAAMGVGSGAAGEDVIKSDVKR